MSGDATNHGRVGLGFDVHRLVEGRPCRLGGIDLPHPTGPSGHSDGDAVLHAISDALLGAAGLDDLGSLFPDTDPAWKDVDSRELLAELTDRVLHRRRQRQHVVRAPEGDGLEVGHAHLLDLPGELG